MTTELLLNLRRLLIEAFFLSIPEALITLSVGFILCGLKDLLSKNKVILFTIFIVITDIIIRFIFEASGLHSLIYLVLIVLYFRYLFGLRFTASIFVTFTSFIFLAVTQFLYIPLSPKLYNINYDNLLNTTELPLIFQKIGIMYVCYLLCFIFIIYIYKKNIVILDLKRYILASVTTTKYQEDILNIIKLSLAAFTPLLVFIITFFGIYYFQIFNKVEISPLIYLLINSIAVFITCFLIFFLVKRIINLNYYKVEWQHQQQYIDGIDILLKELRKQKHGFNNHLNVIYGYLCLKHYDKAKEYLKNINNIPNEIGSIIDVDNLAINAILNIKAKLAESKNIKFEAYSNTDLSNFNFNVFEIGEAIGSIIDNAIEATSSYHLDKNIKVNIDSNDNYHIFNIINTGQTISKEILKQMFEEGFTTKDYEQGDHGFGLFICKKIIENNKGKIEVESDNDITSFKLYLPKVMKSEFKPA